MILHLYFGAEDRVSKVDAVEKKMLKLDIGSEVDAVAIERLRTELQEIQARPTYEGFVELADAMARADAFDKLFRAQAPLKEHCDAAGVMISVVLFDALISYLAQSASATAATSKG